MDATMSLPTTDHADLAARHLSPVLGRYFEKEWSRGEGHRLYDSDGRAYLDFANGIAVSVLGHRHPAVTAAIHEQVDRLIAPMAAMGYAEPTIELAAAVAAVMPDPLDSVFFLNSGSEAIEAALKLARRVTGRPGIIAFRDGFHGRTFGAASVTTSGLNYRRGYEPFLPGVYFAPFPNVYRDFAGDEAGAVAGSLRQLEDLVETTIPGDAVAAVIIEAVQGEGGYNPAPPAFLRGLREFCDRHGILLIVDEVQSGFGRTGRMFAFEHAGIVPDVVALAKAIANGLPLSAIVTARALQARWGRSAHGTTFGGNPVACAAGLAVLSTIRSEGLVENAAARGAELSAGLRDLMAADARIGDVRGPGLMIGMELVSDRERRTPDAGLAERFMTACLEDGLLLLSCGRDHNVIRFIAPLNVTADEVTEGLGIVRGALARIG